MRVIITNYAWLPVSEIDQVDLHVLKNNLTIIPKAMGAFAKDDPKPVRLFKMALSSSGSEMIGVPRAFFFDVWMPRQRSKYNFEIESRIANHELLASSSSLITLRPEDQEPDVGKMLAHLKATAEKNGCGYGIFSAFTAYGKCKKVGEKVVMFDGTFKNVEDVKVGDELMGPDSTPRRVLSIVRGSEMLYKIKPIHGQEWFCTADHILNLKITNHSFKQYQEKMKPGSFMNVSVRDYLNLPNWKKHLLKQHWSRGVDFKNQEVPYEPYLIGVWLGDGTATSTQITNPEFEIKEYLEGVVHKMGLRLFANKTNEDGGCASFNLSKLKGDYENPFRQYVTTQCFVNNEKIIPKAYLCNSRKNRLDLLAGILDTDGFLEKNSGTVFEVTTKYAGFKDDILFLSRSLGFRCSVVLKKSTIKSSGFEGYYWRIGIFGDTHLIPTLVKRKQAVKRKQKKDHLVSGFAVSEASVMEYAGFALDGDHLFLNEDFSVTHNSFSCLEMIRRLRLKSIIVLHQVALLQQWKRAIEKVMPEMRVGVIQGKVCDYKNKDIVLGMLQSLMTEDAEKYPKDMWDSFGTFIVDECHRVGSECFGSVAPKFNTKYSIGVSGTVRRLDGCEDVFRYVIGDIAVRATEINRLNPVIWVRKTGYRSSGSFAQLEKPTILNIIAKSQARNTLIAEDIFRALKAKRAPLVMSERLEMLYSIASILDGMAKSEGMTISQGFYIGGKKEAELMEAANADVVFATVQLAKEGIDIPRLDTLFQCSPVSDNEQIAGRICRRDPNKQSPVLLDYYDEYIAKFGSLYRSRLRLYRDLKWKIIGQ